MEGLSSTIRKVSLSSTWLIVLDEKLLSQKLGAKDGTMTLQADHISTLILAD